MDIEALKKLNKNKKLVKKLGEWRSGQALREQEGFSLCLDFHAMVTCRPESARSTEICLETPQKGQQAVSGVAGVTGRPLGGWSPS